MKRCPACKRVEPDDALVFCRADGTPLVVNDAGPASAEAGTMRLASSPIASESETSVLSQHATDADMNRPTAPTTVLDRQQAIRNTRGLGKRKWPSVGVLSVGAIAVIVLAVFAAMWMDSGFFISITISTSRLDFFKWLAIVGCVAEPFDRWRPF